MIFNILNGAQKALDAKSTLPDGDLGASVPAVMRAIDVLEEVASAHEPLSLAELSKRLPIPKSSLLGICGTLVRRRLLGRTQTGSYRLGIRVVDLSHSYLATSSLTTSFVNAWDAHPRHDETMALSILDGTEVTYIACRYGRQDLSLRYKIGMRRPANCTASGKALLSTLPIERIRALYRDKALARLTAKSLSTLPALLADLATIRKRGYSIDDEETREGMCGISVPIFEHSQDAAVGAVSIGMLAKDLKSARTTIASLVTFSENLTKRLGGNDQGWRAL